jgi:atlastin
VSAKGDKLKGQPLSVVEAKDDHTFELNIENLESVLLRPEVRDRHVVVLSVAGAFRKGKSFLLDFFLRYLNAQVSSNDHTDHRD